MENLLLVWDEIDDLLSMFRAILPSIVSFLAAVALFIATGFLFLYAPIVVTSLSALLVVVGFVLGQKNSQKDSAFESLESQT